MLGADDSARAQVVGHGPTGHAAGSRTLQRLDDLDAVMVGQPDIEQHMDVIRCRIDVGHHRVDGCIGVRQEAGGIAAHRIKSTDRLPQPKEVPVRLRNDGRKVHRIAGGVRRNLRQAFEDGVQPLHTAAADVHLTQKQIGHDPHQREHAYDHHPSDSGRGVTMGPK
jgi:hypothetical protein